MGYNHPGYGISPLKEIYYLSTLAGYPCWAVYATEDCFRSGFWMQKRTTNYNNVGFCLSFEQLQPSIDLCLVIWLFLFSFS